MKKILTLVCVIALASCGSPEQDATAAQADSTVAAEAVVDTAAVTSTIADTTVTASVDTMAQ